MSRLKNKYKQLQNLVGQTLKENQVDFIEDIHKKHSDVEGQLRQYLNQVQDEHKKKWQTIKQLEDNYKDRLSNNERDRHVHYEQQLKDIQRRGRVEREVQLLQEEAKSIREAERAMVRKVEELSLMRKEELLRQNEALREEQRLFF